MLNIIPVIMAGGSGTRLWPLSRIQFPKQFLKLSPEGSTLLQSTLTRLNQIKCQTPILICNEEHRFLAAEQLRAIDQTSQIILEPEGKNTAPAIALAALTALAKADLSDPILLVLSADHIIENKDEFTKSILNAIPLAQEGKLVTFGVIPTYAEIGYGYIKKGESKLKGYQVEKFVEKPDLKTAESYFQSGNYFWNSGMFMFKASSFLSELKKHATDIYDTCEKSVKNISRDLDFIRINKETFSTCRSESIDYAVMEHTSDAVVVPIDAGWSDVGSWSAIWDVQQKDERGNVSKGDIISLDCDNNYLHSEHRLVAALGIDNLVVIETKDSVLVAHKDKVQDIKKIVELIKLKKRTEHYSHREVYRPWGKYDSIDSSERYQVKRITVKPGHKLSVQMHHHRSEHWIVVSGTARILKGSETFLLTENQSTYIPVGEIHALENPGKVLLELIEVQSGSYLGEDDIIRFEDRYGRN